MKETTCVIIGGGHAGIHAVKALWKAVREDPKKRRLRLILIDKAPYHVRKVLLFRPAVGGDDITVPWTKVLPKGVQFVQGTVQKVESRQQQLRYQDAAGNRQLMKYDILVVAMGSVVRKLDALQGGIALTGLEAARNICDRWRLNLRKAAVESTSEERERLLTATVAGAGLTGMETAAELALAMREEAAALGIDRSAVKIYLLNDRDRLFPEGPPKAGKKLESILSACGVTVRHHCKAVQEENGQLSLESGERLSVGLCVWTLGLLPNPVLKDIGLPLTPEGQVIVDECYRAQGTKDVYSIGDCARIVDPASGRVDRMTCGEAVMQANRLGKVVAADLNGRPAPVHKGVMDGSCIGLGPERGLLWFRHWGLDIVLTGKLAWKIKNLAWDAASLLK